MEYAVQQNCYLHERKADILVALAGVVNYHAECQSHCQTVYNTNCLDYGGTRSTNLLPKDFWKLVWGREEESISRSQTSLHRLCLYSPPPTISLCIPREKLLEYFLHLCRDNCQFTDEDDVLQAARLQRKLRQHDEEAVYQTLEKLYADVKRRQRGNISVNTFICVALNLLCQEKCLTSLAADVIKELTRITSAPSGINSDNTSMPFLRASGPCCVFAKTLNTFTNQLNISQFPRERESRADTLSGNLRCSPVTAVYHKRVGAGCAFSPISSTLLWGLQSRAAEEYRMASLAAYNTIFGGATGGSGDTDPRQQYQQRGYSRPSETTMWLRGADTDALHCGVHLLSVEDESSRVRSLALEAIQLHRSNLGLSRAKFRSTNNIIRE